MSNLSSASPPVNTYATFGATGYVAIGFVSGVSNLMVALSILKYSALRHLNQYIMLMALAFGDAVTMFGYVGAGLFRLWLIAHDNMGLKIRAVQCLLVPHLPCWLLAKKFSHLMLVVIALDRLFLVAKPATYILQLPNPQYSLALVLSAFGLTTLMSGVGVMAILVKPSNVTVPALCYWPIIVEHDPNIWAQSYSFYYYNISAAFGFASVCIFAAIVPIYKFKNSTQLMTAEQEASLLAERRMTKSLTISGACTLFLFCIPNKLYPIAWAHGYHLSSWLFILLNMTNALANIFIYQLRHAEMRIAMGGLITGKHLPVMLNLWPVTQTNPSGQAQGKAFQPVDNEATRSRKSRPTV